MSQIVKSHSKLSLYKELSLYEKIRYFKIFYDDVELIKILIKESPEDSGYKDYYKYELRRCTKTHNNGLNENIEVNSKKELLKKAFDKKCPMARYVYINKLMKVNIKHAKELCKDYKKELCNCIEKDKKELNNETNKLNNETNKLNSETNKLNSEIKEEFGSVYYLMGLIETIKFNYRSAIKYFENALVYKNYYAIVNIHAIKHQEMINNLSEEQVRFNHLTSLRTQWLEYLNSDVNVITKIYLLYEFFKFDSRINDDNKDVNDIKIDANVINIIIDKFSDNSMSHVGNSMSHLDNSMSYIGKEQIELYKDIMRKVYEVYNYFKTITKCSNTIHKDDKISESSLFTKLLLNKNAFAPSAFTANLQSDVCCTINKYIEIFSGFSTKLMGDSIKLMENSTKFKYMNDIVNAQLIIMNNWLLVDFKAEINVMHEFVLLNNLSSFLSDITHMIKNPNNNDVNEIGEIGDVEIPTKLLETDIVKHIKTNYLMINLICQLDRISDEAQLHNDTVIINVSKIVGNIVTEATKKINKYPCLYKQSSEITKYFADFYKYA